MNELDTFTVNFIVNGLDKLKDGIKDLRTQMDNLDTSFTQSTTKGDSFFGKFSGWVTSLAGLTAGFLSVRDAINGTFAVADKVIDLNLTADKVGRTAVEVETLSRALRGFSKNTNADLVGEAGNLYSALNKITGKAWRLQFGKDLTDELNRAGGIVFTGEESDQEMVSKIIQGLEYHTQREDWYSRSQFANMLGLSETATAFLSSGQANVDRILKAEREKTFLSNEDNLKNAEALRKARLELKDTWDKIYLELQPAVTRLLEGFNLLLDKLSPILKGLVTAVSWIMEQYTKFLDWAKDSKIGRTLTDWLGDTTAERNANSAIADIQKWYDTGEWKNMEAVVIQQKLAKASWLENFGDPTKEQLELLEKGQWMLNQLRNNHWNTNNTTNNKTANVTIKEQNFYGDTKTLAKNVEKAVGNGVNVALIGKDSLGG